MRSPSSSLKILILCFIEKSTSVSDSCGVGIVVTFPSLGGFRGNSSALSTDAGDIGNGQKLQGVGEEGDGMTGGTS